MGSWQSSAKTPPLCAQLCKWCHAHGLNYGGAYIARWHARHCDTVREQSVACYKLATAFERFHTADDPECRIAVDEMRQQLCALIDGALGPVHLQTAACERLMEIIVGSGVATVEDERRRFDAACFAAGVAQDAADMSRYAGTVNEDNLLANGLR